MPVDPQVPFAGTYEELLYLASLEGGGGGPPEPHASSHEAGGDDAITNLGVADASLFSFRSDAGPDYFAFDNDGAGNHRLLGFAADGSTPRLLIGVDGSDEPSIQLFGSDGASRRILIDDEGNPGLNVYYDDGVSVAAQMTRGFVGANTPDQVSFFSVDATTDGFVTVNVNNKLTFDQAGSITQQADATNTLYGAAGLADASRPAVPTQVVAVDVDDFNAIRTAMIALGIWTDGD